MTRVEVTTCRWQEMGAAQRSAYEAVVRACPYSTVFHAAAWLDAVQESFSPRLRCLLAHAAGRVVGAFPFFALAGPCPGQTNHSSLRDRDMVYGGPIVAPRPSTPELELAALRALLERFEAGPRTLAAVILPPPGFPCQVLAARGYRMSAHLTAIVDLARSREALWAAVHPKTRNMISKARRAGLDVREAGEADLAVLPSILATPFLKAGRRPPPASFLLRVARGLSRTGLARVLVAVGPGGAAPVAAAIFLRHQARSYYWAGGAVRAGYEAAASHLVQWRGIEAASVDGCLEHDLVMVDPVAAPGIARFKLRFGAQVVPLYTASRRKLAGRVLGRAWSLAGSAARGAPAGSQAGRRP